MKDRVVIGLVETVVLEGNYSHKAKIDTGADSSSIDEALVKKLGRDDYSSYKVVRSALGRSKRPTVMLELEMEGKKFYERFTVTDRQHLHYKVLIGKDVLKKEGLIIDPLKK